MSQEKIKPAVDFYAPDFELPGVDKEVHHLTRYLEKFRAVGVVFMSNNCPVVRSYLDKLKAIQQEFEPQGFTLIGINSNDLAQNPDEGIDQMVAFAQTLKLNFPYLRDPSQDVALGFNATKTPEIFLLDNQGVVRYRGKIDSGTQSREQVETAYLKNRIAALLNGEQIELSYTEPVGSTIKWRQNNN